VLAVAGDVVYVRVAVDGFKGRTVSLRWSLYHAAGGRRVSELSDQSGSHLTLQAPRDRTTQQLWVPDLVRGGTYFVRVELYDDRGTMLDVANSPHFRGLRPHA
jgi:hypothetical protein